MPKSKKQSGKNSPTKKSRKKFSKKSSKSASTGLQSPHGGQEICPNCGKRGADCVCDKNLPPTIGLNRNVANMPPSAHQVNWAEPDRYSLPPVDKSEYDLRLTSDFRTTESEASKTSSRSHKSRKDNTQILTTRWTEEFLVKSPRTGYWCRDCPWLLLYAVLLITWLVLVGVCSFQNHFNYDASPSPDDYSGGDRFEAKCLSICSRLQPPENLTAPEKVVFHCTLNQRWEGANETIYLNPNCAEDCKAFGNVGPFISACTTGYDGDASGRSSLLFKTADEETLDWHWIAHIMVITNTLSLFLLLVPLFFCCMQVVIISLASVGICIALTLLLWYYVYTIIKKAKDKFSPTTPFFLYQTVFAALVTILTVYVIIVALIVLTKRLRVSCEVARFTSKFVNSVPTILLETLLTLILLLLWAVAILFASFGIERGESINYFSGDIKPILPIWAVWAMRTLTGIIAFWTAQFIINCQTIIIHGAIARFYFDKEMPDRVMKSHKRLLKYHVCTACFAGILFNWLYWLRWVYPKSIIRSRSLFGTATFGAAFIRAGKEVSHLLHPPDRSRLKPISKVNPFYFLMHIAIFAILCIVTHLVFFVWKSTLYIELILVFYAYFVGLATVNTYRVTKDSVFLCYELDRSLTSLNPARHMKMRDEDEYLFAPQSSRRVNPR